LIDSQDALSSPLRQLMESSMGAETFVDALAVELEGLAGNHTVQAVRWQCYHGTARRQPRAESVWQQARPQFDPYSV
jgi:hypothetical protein